MLISCWDRAVRVEADTLHEENVNKIQKQKLCSWVASYIGITLVFWGRGFLAILCSRSDALFHALCHLTTIIFRKSASSRELKKVCAAFNTSSDMKWKPQRTFFNIRNIQKFHRAKSGKYNRRGKTSILLRLRYSWTMGQCVWYVASRWRIHWFFSSGRFSLIYHLNVFSTPIVDTKLFAVDFLIWNNLWRNHDNYKETFSTLGISRNCTEPNLASTVGEAKLWYCCARDITGQWGNVCDMWPHVGESIDFSIRVTSMFPAHQLSIRSSLLLIFLFGTTCGEIISFWSQHVIIMILLADFSCQTFFQHGCYFHF